MGGTGLWVETTHRTQRERDSQQGPSFPILSPRHLPQAWDTPGLFLNLCKCSFLPPPQHYRM